MALLLTLGGLIVQLLPIITFFIAGILLRIILMREWQGDLKRLKTFQRGTNLVLMEILLPAVAFLSMARIPTNIGWSLLWVPILGLAVALLALAINNGVLRLIAPNLTGAERGAFNMLAPWSNTVIVGLPTVATLLGPTLLYVPFLESSFVWTLVLGPLIIQGTAQGGRILTAVRSLLRSFWFWMIPLGLVWSVFGLPLDGIALVILERAREAFLAVGLIVVGVGLDPAQLHPSRARHLPLGAIGWGGVVKLLLCPLLAICLALTVQVPHDVARALALTVAAPPSLTAYIIGEREGADTEFMSFVFALYGVFFFVTILIVRGVLLPWLLP